MPLSLKCLNATHVRLCVKAANHMLMWECRCYGNRQLHETTLITGPVIISKRLGVGNALKVS